jgi:hypothetical protein
VIFTDILPKTPSGKIVRRLPGNHGDGRGLSDDGLEDRTSIDKFKIRERALVGLGFRLQARLPSASAGLPKPCEPSYIRSPDGEWDRCSIGPSPHGPKLAIIGHTFIDLSRPLRQRCSCQPNPARARRFTSQSKTSRQKWVSTSVRGPDVECLEHGPKPLSLVLKSEVEAGLHQHGLTGADVLGRQAIELFPGGSMPSVSTVAERDERRRVDQNHRLPARSFASMACRA